MGVAGVTDVDVTMENDSPPEEWSLATHHKPLEFDRSNSRLRSK
jgi:hypothetical protein